MRAPLLILAKSRELPEHESGADGSKQAGALTTLDNGALLGVPLHIYHTPPPEVNFT